MRERIRRSLVSSSAAVALTAATAIVSCGDSDDGPRTDDLPVGEITVIPEPLSVVTGQGHLYLERSARVVLDGVRFGGAVDACVEVLRRSTGFVLPIVTGRPAAGDVAVVEDESIAAEGYVVEVNDLDASVRASSPAGAFYGCQTLRQLLPPEIESAQLVDDVEWKLPMVTIVDEPRFEWRGVMLDVARHFFGVSEVQRVAELAARYKVNRLHLHLTDDQGWRIHIDSWPDLTAIGSRMDASGGEGGFFSQADYAAIVEYAAARFVTVVPEIDMPGHTNAALASYGELNESGEPTELRPFIPFGSSSLWLEGPATLGFVEDVLSEVAAMTPGPYVHIGGDEAAATPPELYDEFMLEVRDILGALGKTMVGWEEIGTTEVAPPFVAQYWLAASRAVSAYERGGRLVSSPAGNAYLDMKYDSSTPIGLNWAGFTDVEDAYRWQPVPAGVAEGAVLGVEAPLWTETVDSRADIDLLMFPRLLGHAEIGWSPAGALVWEDYRRRLATHGPRLEISGVAFYRDPKVDWPTAD